MQNLLSQIGRLRGRSLHELSTRASQALTSYSERRGLSSEVRVPDDPTFVRRMLGGAEAQEGDAPEALLRHFRTRERPCFFASFEDRTATVAELRARWPAAERRVIQRTEKILEGKFDLLGCQALWFGDPVDWRLEPVAARTTPLVHWSQLDFLDPAVVGDHKLVWELNRHQYFLTLGQAYWYTGDERYAAAFVQHLTAWMDANPPKRGINWASSLELAFRAISWIWALHFFRDSAQLTPAVFLRALKFLYLHGRHVETYLSTYFSPNTHLTGEALGLFYLGTTFPELRCAARWRQTGLRILTERLGTQVQGDGVYFEQSTYYHRYTTDFYIHLLILSRIHGIELDAVVRRKLEALLDHLMYMARPDGLSPLIGDDDGGKLVCLDERNPTDFRASLATGAVLFGRADLRFVAGEAAEETFWLLGAEGAQAFDAIEPTPPHATSVAFRDGGYFVMRDGWAPDANYLVVDCGPHGTQNCGHAHADALALELAAQGRTLLIDPGTYTYTGVPELRDHFRSSLVHNTVSVDGLSSSVPSGPFRWQHIAQCSLRRWITAERVDFFEGSHDGYARLPDPAIHTRSVLFVKGGYWVVRDRVTAREEHRVEVRFRFAPGVRLSQMPQGVAATIDSARLRIAILGAEDVRCEDAPVSPSYGELTDAPGCAFAAHGVGDQEVFSFLLPGSEFTDAVRAETASGGRMFALRCGDWEDQVAVAAPEREVEGGRLRSHFAWTWLRRSAADGTLRELAAIDGSRLEWDGDEVFRSEAPVGYVTACLRDGELWVETDATSSFRISGLGARTVRVNGTEFPVGPDGRCAVDGAPLALLKL